MWRQVRLAAGYRKVGDARKGPLRGWKGGGGPGETGEGVDVQDRLVQVSEEMELLRMKR